MNDSAAPQSLASRLSNLLLSDTTAVLMEAHNGLSAKLAAEAGFQALWGSGLSISAALGVRDNNEASWTQVLEVLEFMADASGLPILLDGDTGYGNFNNVRRLIRKLEQRNIAGVCMEDKLFPKCNSFIDGERQALAEVDEFCGKLRAAKDTQRDPDFVLVARTEAFIAGWGLDEALLRAHAYAAAGADVILVHSKRKDCKEILAFMERWENRAPVIIVPTMYPSEPLSRFVGAGVNNFIFANQSLRTVIASLQQNLRTLHDSLDLMSIEDQIAPVSEIFRLQDVQELKDSEQLYLPQNERQETRALVLAASKGSFGELVKDRPKAMLRLRGKPILTWHTEAFRRQGIRQIGAVRGYRKQAMDLGDIRYFDNDEYATTGELASLFVAREFIEGDLVIAYGDIVFDDFILGNLLSQTSGISIAVDGAWSMRMRSDAKRDLVVTEGAPDPFGKGQCRLLEIGGQVEPERAMGEWIGLLCVRGEATTKLRHLLETLAVEDPELLRVGDLPQLLGRLLASGQSVSVVHSFGHWYDLDDQEDLLLASAVVRS